MPGKNPFLVGPVVAFALGCAEVDITGAKIDALDDVFLPVDSGVSADTGDSGVSADTGDPCLPSHAPGPFEEALELDLFPVVSEIGPLLDRTGLKVSVAIATPDDPLVLEDGEHLARHDRLLSLGEAISPWYLPARCEGGSYRIYFVLEDALPDGRDLRSGFYDLDVPLASFCPGVYAFAYGLDVMVIPYCTMDHLGPDPYWGTADSIDLGRFMRFTDVH